MKTLLTTAKNVPHIKRAAVVAIAVLLGCQTAQASDLTDAVVRVYAGRAAGSGTLVQTDRGTGWVMTAAHVVAGESAFRVVWQDGFAASATLLGADENLDVALLQVAPPPGAQLIPLAGEDQWPPQGETVELIGYGGGRLRHWTATVNGYAFTRGTGQHQTLSLDTQTISGDSGGAIVYRGRLVGVIWGGPLAGPRGPMLATHGTCCVAIQRFVNGLLPPARESPAHQISGVSAPGCIGGNCPLAPRYPPPRIVPQQPKSTDTQQLYAAIARLQAQVDSLKQQQSAPPMNERQIVSDLIQRIADDERFRGPPGENGKPGRDGRPGKDATDVDVDALAEQVKQRISGSIRIRVEPAK